MILASVGTQLPFDRLIRAIDQWAEENGRTDVVGQIGPARYAPRAMRCFPFIEHRQFHELQLQCSLMVSHAGMGSLIGAMELGKPIIILARDHRRGEHRNGHQLATLGQFRNFPGIYAANDEDHVKRLLDRSDQLTAPPPLDTQAPSEFIERLAAYVHDTAPSGIRARLQWMKRRSAGGQS
ncbi:glycosyltransferase [Novosphingobium soli]|uniref:Glycosyltransferase n=1 Tax=Novosphingobium soli TaxID=574956 RepID=A0ABV6CWH4_9SPHN